MYFWERWKRNSDNLERIATALESLLKPESAQEETNPKISAELTALKQDKPDDKSLIENAIWQEDNLSEEERSMLYD
jgi:hypothetical protein